MEMDNDRFLTVSHTRPSFEKVYESLFTLIYRISYRITGRSDTAEDMVQEAFIKYYENAHKIPDLEQSKYWLIRVVKNLSLNHEKRKGRERNAVDKIKRIPQKLEASAEENLIREETRTVVQEALNKLPHNLRSVLVLRDYADMNYKEIGDTLNISEGNVKVRVFRAREKLATILKEGEEYVS
jgi:RNA polymerase sigma-70 factor (ECF subfamily)